MMEVVFTSEASGLLQQDYTALYPRRLPSSYMFDFHIKITGSCELKMDLSLVGIDV
jgi:hypothetical protein